MKNNASMKSKIVTALFTWLVCLNFVITGLYFNISEGVLCALLIVFTIITLSYVKYFKKI